MFDEILAPSKARSSRKQAWLWIGVSLLGLLFAAIEIIQHREIWWLMAGAWTFTLVIWIRRLVVCWRGDDPQTKVEKTSNGQ
jgi:hypothetical protein